LSQTVLPHLTTIKQDSETIGKILAQKLIMGMKDKKTAPELIEVRASLIVGESTGEPRR
jgi:DNA-binding LacI/PurR family transcriptional regulator